MYFFYSSKWDHFRISIIIRNLNNISSFTNVRYSSSLHQNEIIWEILWKWWISTSFHHWPTFHRIFLDIKMRSFYNLPDDDQFPQYFIIDHNSIYFFSLSKWDDYTISFSMMNSNNFSSFTNIQCTFPPHQNEIVLEFLLPSWISTKFQHWPKSDVLSPLMKMWWF